MQIRLLRLVKIIFLLLFLSNSVLAQSTMTLYSDEYERKLRLLKHDNLDLFDFEKPQLNRSTAIGWGFSIICGIGSGIAQQNYAHPDWAVTGWNVGRRSWWGDLSWMNKYERTSPRYNFINTFDDSFHFFNDVQNITQGLSCMYVTQGSFRFNSDLSVNWRETNKHKILNFSVQYLLRSLFEKLTYDYIENRRK